MTFRAIRRSMMSVVSALGLIASISAFSDVTLLNVSYDPTRELYKEYNRAFARYWQERAHEKVTVQQSHGGSGKQARSIIDGLEADVATLGIGYDMEAVQKAGLIAPDWRKRLPFNAAPYTSTIVFVVRKGNPKGIRDWADLVKPGVSVITSNPKVSGGGRWGYLAAWGYAQTLKGGSAATARDFVTRLYKSVPVLDSGARGSTTTFAQRGLGDVLIAWESEAFVTLKAFYKDGHEIVYPSLSILAEPPVSVVDRFVDKHHTRPIATAYLQYLYSPEGQAIAAKHFYRPHNAKLAKQFPPIKMFTFEKVFGNWQAAHSVHFAQGAIFDQIMRRH
ncbi:MAG: sulfate ABC transporter substrate-binding protein [Armatimonadetes bacterium]|nr:sulfate ABC transporter substrate-binding protein [Armatimonadota bacterium]